MDTTIDVGEQAREAVRGLDSLRPPLLLRLALARLDLRIWRRRLAKLYRHTASRLTACALFFRGLRATISQEAGRPIDRDFALVDQLVEGEQLVQGLLDDLNAAGSKDETVNEARIAAAAAAASLIEEIRLLRGEVQAYEADRSALQPPEVARSPEQLEKALEKL